MKTKALGLGERRPPPRRIRYESRVRIRIGGRMTSKFNGDFVVGRYISGKENVINGGDCYLSQTYTDKTSVCARQVKKMPSAS